MSFLKGYILYRVLKEAEKVCKDFKGRILDLGCGKGELLKSLKLYSNLKPIGLDISEKQLFWARGLGLPLIRGDFFLLPFKDSVVEAVTCLNTIYNFETLETFRPGFIEMERVTVPGGRIVIDIRNRKNPFLELKYWWHMKKGGFPTISYSPDEIVKVFEGLGCDLERIESVGLKIPFLSLGYIMVFRKGSS
jgi:ubiquinone/menaquinone biosynthesis C-methylase UbiE